MSARVIRITHTGEQIPPTHRRREWIEVGHPLCVRGAIVMAVEAGRDELKMDLYNSDGGFVNQFSLSPLHFQPYAPYTLIPRAVEVTRTGRPVRVFFETQYTGIGNPEWLQTRGNQA